MSEKICLFMGKPIETLPREELIIALRLAMDELAGTSTATRSDVRITPSENYELRSSSPQPEGATPMEDRLRLCGHPRPMVQPDDEPCDHQQTRKG